MLLVGNGRLITRDNNGFYENGAVAIEGNIIKEVGDFAALNNIRRSEDLSHGI